jgi:hypothetical protein
VTGDASAYAILAKAKSETEATFKHIEAFGGDKNAYLQYLIARGWGGNVPSTYLSNDGKFIVPLPVAK